MSIKERMIRQGLEVQDQICKTLSDLNEIPAKKNQWTVEKGEGIAYILPSGKIFEKGGISFSKVHGKVFPSMHKMLTEEDLIDPDTLTFFATGISIVLHPNSPRIPTVHANYRYFEIEKEGKPISWFFGGGSDLTPYYLFEEDAKHFHSTLKKACDIHDLSFYPTMKKAADDYFYLPHRKEHRGIGGIFVLRINDKDPELLLNWTKSCSEAFLPSYLPIVERRKGLDYTEQEKNWQLVRRGRYVEFNLMYDVGTLFGLKLSGTLFGEENDQNIENILMSLPPLVCWEYKYPIEKNSPESKLLEVIKHPKSWTE